MSIVLGERSGRRKGMCLVATDEAVTGEGVGEEVELGGSRGGG
jgi:hypothetical protein